MKRVLFWAFVGIGLGAVLWQALGCKVSGTPPSSTPQAQASTRTQRSFGYSPSRSFYYQRVRLPGDKAPDFKVRAVVGNEIKDIKLSDYRGKWVVLFFYPADFTFV